MLGALFRLDEFLLSPQAQVHCGPVPETSRKSNGENQETNEETHSLHDADRSPNDPLPEVSVSLSQEFSPNKTSNKNNLV